MAQQQVSEVTPVGVWLYIEQAQREGLNRTTAWGAYKKAGGNMPVTRFRALWRLARLNPFRFGGL